MRRNVGPVAWAVLEALAEHAVVDGTTTMSYRSVRDIAADLHLANDTVARALRRLADHGLAQHRADRSTTGRFATGHYLLTLPPDVLTPTTTTAPTPPNQPTDITTQPDHHTTTPTHRTPTTRPTQPTHQRTPPMTTTRTPTTTPNPTARICTMVRGEARRASQRGVRPC